MGRDSESSAQSKHVGGGETARLELAWGGLGQTGGERGARGVDGAVGDAGGVYQAGSGETARFGGFWGEQGGWLRFWGCSAGSGSMSRRFRAVARGPEWGRTGGSAVVDDDVAVALGVSRCRTGVMESGRGELGGADGFPGLRCRSWGWEGRSVKYTTRLDERSCSSSRELVCCAVDGLCGLFTAW
jgi:hypothetical protein